MKSIDPKSLIIGVLSTVLIFVLIGAKPQNKNNWRIKNLNKVGRIKRKGKKKCRG